MIEWNQLFSTDGLYKNTGGDIATTLLNGHVFLRAESNSAEKETAINICARIGFDVIGYDLPILKIYSSEENINRPVNIFINCGPFIPATAEKAGISVDEQQGHTYVTLYGENPELLREKGKELYRFCAKKKGKNTTEHRSYAPISNDLAEITGINGLFPDRDGDLLADGLIADLILEDSASDEDIINYAHLAARLAGETTEISLPLSLLKSRDQSENTPKIKMDKSACIAYHPSAHELCIGHGASDYFIKAFPYFDKEKTYHLNEATDWLKQQINRLNVLPEKTVFDIEKTLDIWEGDELLSWVREDLLEKINPGDNVTLLAAVSEGKEVRRQIEQEIIRIFKERNLNTPKVNVICAFKQGFSFIEECILPEIAPHKDHIGGITVGFRPLLKSKDQEWDVEKGARPSYGDYSKEKKWFDLPIRWLQELYPVDDIIAETLGLSRDIVTFEPLEFGAENTYEIVVKDKNGSVLLSKSLEVPTVLSDYLHTYASLGSVHIVQGFARAAVNGSIIAQRTIKSDLEYFWIEYQNILKMCRDHILKEGRAQQESQPFFKRLRVEVSASEPDYPLNCRQDLISSLDALHEDIYFAGLDFFRRFGDEATGSIFAEPGLILPVIRKRDGAALSFRATLVEETIRAGSTPAQVYLEKLTVSEGAPSEMHFCTDRSDEELSALKKYIEDDAPSLDFPFRGEFILTSSDGHSLSIRVNHTPKYSKPIDIKEALKTIEDHVIGYEESLLLLNGLRAHDGVRVVKIATSLEGRSIYAVELFEKLPAEITSHVKLIATKPAFFLNNRHHANEVSSTNSAFRLIFKCLSDPEYRAYIRAVNLIVVPLENVDGTAIGYELQKENPRWILHPARYNSVGRDFYFDYFSDKPGECQGLPNIWRKWLPDFMVDNHGVPTHEWSQPFSGYVSPWFRGFWLPRGLFYGYCMYVDDPRYPEIKSYFELVAQKVSEELDRDEGILSASLDWKDRHTKYAHQFMPNMYPQDYVGNWIYYFEGVPHNPQNFHPHIRYPWITTMEWITEIADETAQGDYLGLCSQTHALADLAVIKILSGAVHEAEEYGTDEKDRVHLVKRRTRPVKIVQK